MIDIKGEFIKFEEECGLASKRDKRWFWLAFSFLALYIEFVVFLQFAYFEWIFWPLNLLCAILVLPLCFFTVRFCARMKLLQIKATASLSRKSNAVFIASVFAITFLFYFLWYFAFFPGSFSNDSLGQYEQAITGNYNNWHPAIHTWLFFTLPLALTGKVGSIVLFQVIYFSLAVTYLFWTLRRSGCPGFFMLFSWIYIVANPNTAHIVLYPWKDTAFGIFALVIFTHLIRIYKTNGKWLTSPLNAAAFSAFVFLANTVRHNGILLTVPIFVVLFVFMKRVRLQTVVSALSVITAVLLLNGPVYSLLSVEEPGQRQVETLGLPMTVLANVYMKDRDALGEEAVAFMDSLATKEEWETYHVTGNFNVIKWSSTCGLMDKIEAEGAKKILGYTAEAFAASPRVAFDAFVKLTSLVWGFEGGGHTVSRGIVDNSFGIGYYGSGFISTLLSFYFLAISIFGRYFFNFIGIVIIFMLVTAVGRVGKGDISRSLLVLSPIVYNFGTMLLLTGPDFRFFHFNFLIAVPLTYLFFTKKDAECEKDETALEE